MKNSGILLASILTIIGCSTSNTSVLLGEGGSSPATEPGGKVMLQPDPKREHVIEPVPLNFAQQHTIYSNLMGQNRSFNISFPEGYHQSSEQHTYPVLLLLENEFFQLVSGVVRHLSSVERMPETLVVSLSDEHITPTVYTNGSNFWPMESLPGNDPTVFTDHLRKEFFPYLKENFRANDFHMVMGVSYSSVYVLHTFVKEPALFDAHNAIAAGDMLGMGYKPGENFIDLIAAQIEATEDRKRYLYVTSADGDVAENAAEIGVNLEALNSRLSNCCSNNLKYFSGVYPDEGHYDVTLPALIDALELIFPKEKWFAKYREIIQKPGPAMDNLDIHYRKLSSEYGFEILPRADRWNSVNRLSWIGPYLLKNGKTTDAIQVIERWAEYRPNSLAALEQLAKAYEASGDYHSSLSALQKAYKLALALNREESGKYVSEIARIEKNTE